MTAPPLPIKGAAQRAAMRKSQRLKALAFPLFSTLYFLRHASPQGLRHCRLSAQPLLPLQLRFIALCPICPFQFSNMLLQHSFSQSRAPCFLPNGPMSIQRKLTRLPNSIRTDVSFSYSIKLAVLILGKYSLRTHLSHTMPARSSVLRWHNQPFHQHCQVFCLYRHRRHILVRLHARMLTMQHLLLCAAQADSVLP